MEFRKDRNQNRVSVGVTDGSVRVDFYAFDSSKPNKKDRSGVKISCRKATFPLRESSFTESLCGQCVCVLCGDVLCCVVYVCVCVCTASPAFLVAVSRLVT